MDDLQIDSQAFRKALLASERRRIYGVIAFLLVFAIAIAARIEIFGSRMSPWGAMFLLAMVAYELWTLHEVGNALQTNRELPDWLLWCNILAEGHCACTGSGIFLQSVTGSWLPGCSNTLGARAVSADHAIGTASQSTSFAVAGLGGCMRLSG